MTNQRCVNLKDYYWRKVDFDIADYLQKANIVDNVTSTNTDKALSANQGKLLKDAIDGKASSTHNHDIKYTPLIAPSTGFLVYHDDGADGFYMMNDALYYDAETDSVIYQGVDELATISDIPNMSSYQANTLPLADQQGGDIGSGTKYALANHKHPLSGSYASSTHGHGNLNADGTITGVNVNTDSIFNYFVSANNNGDIYKANNLNADILKDVSSGEYTNLGLSSNGSAQSSINDAINDTIGTLNTAIAGKQAAGDYATSNHTHDGVYQPVGNYLTSSDISGKENIANKSSSIIRDTGSTTKYPTVKAVQDYTQGFFELQPLAYDSEDEPTIPTNNINIDKDVALKVISKDIKGNIIPNYSSEIKISWDDFVYDFTTDANGVYVAEGFVYPPWGMHTFQVGNSVAYINVIGNRNIGSYAPYGTVIEYKDFVVVEGHYTWNTQINTNWTTAQMGLGISSSAYPKRTTYANVFSQDFYIRAVSTGQLQIRTVTGEKNSADLYFSLVWGK